MNSALALASEFIERAANPSFGVEVNEEYALRWALLRQTGNPITELRVGEFAPEDLDILSLDAWIWLGSTLTDGDPELPAPVLARLFEYAPDPVYRLKVADMSLRHPALAKRLGELHRPLSKMPETWVGNRILNLLSRTEGDADLVEMSAILLQVANKPALLLLGALRQERQNVVDDTIRQYVGSESDISSIIERLGLKEP